MHEKGDRGGGIEIFSVLINGGAEPRLRCGAARGGESCICIQGKGTIFAGVYSDFVYLASVDE